MKYLKYLRGDNPLTFTDSGVLGYTPSFHTWCSYPEAGRRANGLGGWIRWTQWGDPFPEPPLQDQWCRYSSALSLWGTTTQPQMIPAYMCEGQVCIDADHERRRLICKWPRCGALLGRFWSCTRCLCLLMTNPDHNVPKMAGINFFLLMDLIGIPLPPRYSAPMRIVSDKMRFGEHTLWTSGSGSGDRVWVWAFIEVNFRDSLLFDSDLNYAKTSMRWTRINPWCEFRDNSVKFY